MADELLDLVDENDNVIGTVWKSEAHGNPKLIHREIAVLLIDNSQNILLQKRSSTKKVNPNFWTISAQGHVGSGEDPNVSVNRELFEELGILCEPTFLFKKLFSDDYESFFVYVYYCKIDRTSKIVIDKDEVSDTSWIKIKDLYKFSKSNKYDFNVSGPIIDSIIEKLKLI